MDAALFFLLVFIIYTVLLALSMFRARLYGKQIENLQHDLQEVRSVIMTQGNVMHDMAQQPNLVQQGVDMAQVQEFLSNPQVQQTLTHLDAEQLETLASNPLVQRALGNN